MIAGHLRIKRGIYQLVLSYTDSSGNRRTTSKSTGLAEKGNKKRAEEMLREAQLSFTITELESPPSEQLPGSMLFADFMVDWLEIVKPTIKRITFSSYSEVVNRIIAPYFRALGVTLQSLNQRHLQDFYTLQLKRVSASSVIHYHANIHKALKYAVKMDMIPSNPADKVERPKKDMFIGSFLDSEEFARLYEGSVGTRLECAVIFGGIYGLRRSEVVGLRWSAIDFTKDTITINHTVTEGFVNSKREVYIEDSTKSKSSYRVLPLIPHVKTWLQNLLVRQKENKRLCGRAYNQEYLDYIYVDELGNLIRADYITSRFQVLLKQCGVKSIRYHDLRHTCASMLMAQSVPMKYIQEWLGHSDFSTTANIYAHLDYSSKLVSANSLVEGFGVNRLFAVPVQNEEVIVHQPSQAKEVPALAVVATYAGVGGVAM